MTDSPKTDLQRGFTLIELMIVVAIVGVLAAIAVPSYQIYIIRSRTTEGLMEASAAKAVIFENAYNNGGAIPAGASACAGVNVFSNGQGGIASVTCENGTGKLTVVMATRANGVELTLTPSTSSAGMLWTCGTVVGNYKYVPAECRH